MKLVPTVEAGILCPDAAEVECIARQLAANGFKGFASEIRRLWVEFDQAQSRIAELEKAVVSLLAFPFELEKLERGSKEWVAAIAEHEDVLTAARSLIGAVGALKSRA